MLCVEVCVVRGKDEEQRREESHYAATRLSFGLS